MVSVITWQTIYLNGIIHSFDLAKANMHVAEENLSHIKLKILEELFFV